MDLCFPHLVIASRTFRLWLEPASCVTVEWDASIRTRLVLVYLFKVLSGVSSGLTCFLLITE